MTLKSDAAPSEKHSPFYLKNEAICLKWERLFEDFGGKSSGEYSAWSYKISATVSTQVHWSIDIIRSTYSSSGIASFNGWNLHESVTMKATSLKNGSDKFLVRRKGIIDYFRKAKVLGINKRYVLVGGRSSLSESLIEILHEPIRKNKLLKMNAKDGSLTISIKSYNDCFSIVRQILGNVK